MAHKLQARRRVVSYEADSAKNFLRFTTLRARSFVVVARTWPWYRMKGSSRES